MSTAVVVFTRDLRVHDNPVLHAATGSADRVVPLFVLDDAILSSAFNRPNRAAFLAGSLADLDGSLRRLGGRLVVRRGAVEDEVAKLADEVGAAAVHIAADYSRYAQLRERRLREALGNRELHVHDSHAVVAPGAVTPSGGSGKDHFAVFSAYYRRWSQAGARPVLPIPDRVTLPRGVDAGRLPTRDDICQGATSADLAIGGEQAARARADDWYGGLVASYDDDGGHDDLANENGTSKLSPYLHFGCISPVELVARADRRKRGVDAYLRQLAWRDFFTQVLAARPEASRADYRTKHDRWRRDDEAVEAWRDGRTGYPLVDAGMRQLKREGWMHNRARLVTASFLTKYLYVDWRIGARHFFDHLVDGDVANNCLNWQWVAGTGTDTRPNRVLNPTRQQQRYDPNGVYVKRYVEEFGTPDYPPPIVDHADAVSAFRAARGR
ncbi:MAG: deoxyribodipyrimidine photo-lyase [Frankiales bacterium]|nr:deoxyribodipyrimidine photo-lyase [Frankiales bacterium]